MQLVVCSVWRTIRLVNTQTWYRQLKKAADGETFGSLMRTLRPLKSKTIRAAKSQEIFPYVIIEFALGGSNLERFFHEAVSDTDTKFEAAKSTEYESLNSAAFIRVTTPASSKAEETWVSKAHAPPMEVSDNLTLKSPGELASKREFIDVVFDGIKEGSKRKMVTALW